MQRTLVTLTCTLALACGGALAQQQQQPQQPGNAPEGSITDKAKQAAQTVAEKTKQAAATVKDKAQETAQKAKTAADEKTGDAGEPGQSSAMQQKQRQADEAYKSAKAKCDTVQQKAQKNLCEKQATAAHAKAEVEIAQANVAAEGGQVASGSRKSQK
jgi:hypothetical protein